MQVMSVMIMSDNVTSSFCLDKVDWNATNCQGTSTCMTNDWYQSGNKKYKTRKFFESQKCGPYNRQSNFPVCVDGKDQINCTNRDVWFKCEHYDEEKATKYSISLTDQVLCQEELNSLCVDNLNNMCERPQTNCPIHRHFRCDGYPNCELGLDEKYCDEITTEINCVRRIRNRSTETESLRSGQVFQPTKLPILIDWVLDSIVDCENGEDENPDLWKTCQYQIGKNQTIKHYTFKSRIYACNITYNCESESKLVDITKICDGNEKNDCSLGSQNNINKETICRVTRNKDNMIVKAMTNIGRDEVYKYITPCLPGIARLGDCKEYILEESYGTIPIKIIAPRTRSVRCRNNFGEIYVYAACLGLCLEDGITCPLDIFEVDFSASCAEMDRILTLTKDNKLTFVKEQNKAGGSAFVNRELFSCGNGRCVDYSEVCDLINNCGDNSDEKHCNNHFSCDDEKREIILASQWCDGIVHCSNSKDECSSECPKQNDKRLITSVYLQTFAWFFGVSTILLNAIVLIRNAMKLYIKTDLVKTKLVVTILISLVAFGDFLLGLYMVLISIENVRINNEYCKKENEWLTSSRCEFYGVISTFGSQLSIGAITAVSLYRAMAMRKIRPSRGVRPHSKRFLLQLVIMVSFIALVSFLIAVLPVIPILRDKYFYNGYYIPATTLYLSPKKNEDYAKLLNLAFPGTPTTENSADSNTIKNLLHKMFLFPKDEKDEVLEFSTLGFYGSSGSCIFKYFVDSKDPQRAYSWAVLGFNFVCMVVVALSYVSVHLVSQRSAARVGTSKRFGALQRKISLIIVSDFICWISFILVCVLHYTNTINATPHYSFFSIVVLPMNSFINPLLYDKFFTKSAIKVYQRFDNWRATFSDSGPSRTDGSSPTERTEGQTDTSQTPINDMTDITAC